MRDLTKCQCCSAQIDHELLHEAFPELFDNIEHFEELTDVEESIYGEYLCVDCAYDAACNWNLDHWPPVGLR